MRKIGELFNHIREGEANAEYDDDPRLYEGADRGGGEHAVHLCLRV